MNLSQTINDKKILEVNILSIFNVFVLGLVNSLFTTKNHAGVKQAIDTLRFEISSEKMNCLLLNRQICATDIRCLDANSKQCLKTLCLKTCLRNPSLIQPYQEKHYD
ncbi:MAG: hypothetical protein V3V18_06640 [Methylococcales bacterium]